MQVSACLQGSYRLCRGREGATLLAGNRHLSSDERQAAHMADPILIPDTTTELRPMSRRCGRTLGGRDPLD